MSRWHKTSQHKLFSLKCSKCDLLIWSIYTNPVLVEGSLRKEQCSMSLLNPKFRASAESVDFSCLSRRRIIKTNTSFYNIMQLVWSSFPSWHHASCEWVWTGKQGHFSCCGCWGFIYTALGEQSVNVLISLRRKSWPDIKGWLLEAERSEGESTGQ